MSGVVAPSVVDAPHGAGRDAVDASIHLIAEADGGRTRLVTMRSAFPVALRRTGPQRVHLVGTGAWPLGGDRVRMVIEVGPDANLEVAAVAANVALPDRDGRRSMAEVQVRVAARGSLRLDLGPTIVANGADHEASLDVRLGHGARVALRELVILGRENETGGRSGQRLDVTIGGGAVVREHALRPHPRASAFADGGARAVGSVILVDGRSHDRAGGDADAARTGPARVGAAGTGVAAGGAMRVGAVSGLPGDRGWRAVALGDDVAAVAGWLADRWSEATWDHEGR